MIKRTLLLVSAFLMIASPVICADVGVKTMVLPFTVNSMEDLSQLGSQIPNQIKTRLKQDGAIIVEPSISSDGVAAAIKSGVPAIRALGVESGADWIIWGSITWIGQSFSMDMKLMESKGSARPEVYFNQGDGIEGLSGALQKISSSAGLKMFQWKTVAKVMVEGNNRIEADAIKRIIKTKAGDVYSKKNVTNDIRAIYKMGYFDDIQAEQEETSKGIVLKYKVKEKQTIRLIRVKGIDAFDAKEIIDELTISTGSILNIFKVQSNMKIIEELYKGKNYHNVEVSYIVNPLDHNQADLEFIINEGAKVKINEIKFIGNNDFDKGDLLDVMQTNEKGWFSWITSSGELNMEDLERDTQRLKAFYHNNGYVDAAVSEPELDFQEKSINITIKINEGQKYKVGTISIEGDFEVDAAAMNLTKDINSETLLEKLTISEEEFFNGEILRKDVLRLTDLFSDIGFAHSKIYPRTNKDTEKLIVDIVYVITKGSVVYFEKIIITGNTRTRDKVIRRMLPVVEQGRYSGTGLKRGVRYLRRLEYFEDIKVDTPKGSADDKMILKLDVEEKQTGSFTFGGGYSTSEKAFVGVEAIERNFLGRGQTLGVKAEVGGTTTRYSLSFTEPWLFDIPFSAGGDIYNVLTEYDYYDKEANGIGIRLAYPIFRDTQLSFSHYYEVNTTSNISSVATNTYSERNSDVNIFSVALKYDSRNDWFQPTDGGNALAAIEYAGPVGDQGYTRFTTETGWYFPLYWDVIGFTHAKAAYIYRNEGGELPDYKLFRIGGMNSLRGFKKRDLLPRNEYGLTVGGSKYVHFNNELQYPLFKDKGVYLIAFYDAGDLYGDGETWFDTLRHSAGYGFRWKSPVGPIRIECGHILDPEEGESNSGKWEFSMGGAF